MWQISKDYDWDYLRNKFGWINEMHSVPQDPIHHAEGDVGIHTSTVLSSLDKIPEFHQLSGQDQHILKASALLHDVEKRSTTEISETGRVSSPRHALRGESTSQSLLYSELNCPLEIRLMISKLVRLHGLPLWALEKRNPEKEVIKSSLSCDNNMLSILAKADIMGRICADAEDMFYRISLFEEMAKEQECFGNPYSFADAYSRFFYFQKEDTIPSMKAFNESKFEVIMLSALPGSGKDTYLKNHLSDWPVVSLDDIRRKWKISPTDKSGNGRVIQEGKEQAKQFMRKKESFVWNATNITKQLRSQLIDLFVSYGGYVKIVYLEVPYTKLLKQNREREYPVPENVLEKMIHKLEIPTEEEAHEVIYYSK